MAASSPTLRLGVNVDHVATVRNARGGAHPDPIRAALLAQESGADGITAHLREDRRHITDLDIMRLKAELAIPLNMEMAATDEMLGIALKHLPHAVCLVPEKREERTTEGGLDVSAAESALTPFVAKLSQHGVRVSLFIEADPKQLDAAKRIGAPVIELHTGSYCDALLASDRLVQLERIRKAAAYAETLGLECHAGHGLSYETVGPIAAIPTIRELNIGHFLVGEAIMLGLADAIKRMRSAMHRARVGLAPAAS
jgi:pyridoxine 5-phosphate synthase